MYMYLQYIFNIYIYIKYIHIKHVRMFIYIHIYGKRTENSEKCCKQ